MNIEKYLICPICKNNLLRQNNCLKCIKNHSFDFAKSGYINLLNPGKKNNAKAGDSKEMIRARSSFFSSGCYGQIRDTLCDIVKGLSPSVVVDAGCGEGYYTTKIANEIKDALVFGFDMSKFGTEHASKVDKMNGITNTLYSVSNIFDLPLSDECTDVVVNMFAPVADGEFHRILRRGGYLIIGVAGEHHLEGLKRVIYDDVYLNEVSDHAYNGFELVEVKNLKYEAEIVSRETIWALFQMTPYYHRTSLADKEKLDHVDKISSTVEVDFYIFKKI